MKVKSLARHKFLLTAALVMAVSLFTVLLTTGTALAGYVNPTGDGPDLGDVAPTGTVTVNNPTVSAWFGTGGAGDRVNTSSVFIQVDGVTLTGCTLAGTAYDGTISCPTSGLADGTHTIHEYAETIYGDDAWYDETFTVDTVPDTTAPSVTSVLPTGTIATTSATVAAYYNDSDSGINAGSASLTLDGSAMTGCSKNTAGIQCPATGLASGAHTIGGSVADNAGNTATISGGFTVSLRRHRHRPRAASPGPTAPTGRPTRLAAAKTDLCLSCHDVHNAQGDYVLMRESTVTAVCGTCHVVYGAATGTTPSWTEPPCTRAPGDTSSGCTADLNDYNAEAGVSPSAAYKNLTPARVTAWAWEATRSRRARARLR